MKDRRPAPPRTQHRPSRRPIERTAATQPLSEFFPRLVRGCGIGLLVTVAFCIVGSAIATALLLTLPDPCSPLPGVALAVLLLGSLFGAAVAGKISGQRLLLCGLCMSALLLLTMFLGTSLTSEPTRLFSPTASLLLRGAVVVFSLLGAYIGARLPEKRTRRRR
jgi:putative membrane protein (TIGR04086 family)